MAIAHPSTLQLTVIGNLSQDMSQGRVSTTQLLNDTSSINFTAYSQGSIDITSASGNVSLGKYGIIFLTSASPITVHVINGSSASSMETKLFALNGPTAEFEISTSSVLPVTVQWICGTSNPIIANSF
jgi:hypothetical protein